MVSTSKLFIFSISLLFFFSLCKNVGRSCPPVPWFRRLCWFFYLPLLKCAAFFVIFVRMFDRRRIGISIFHCVWCLQLLLLCFPEVVIMNTFLNDKILLKTFKMLYLWVDKFYFLCIFITCDEQTFDNNDEVWVILKDATQIYSLFQHSCASNPDA